MSYKSLIQYVKTYPSIWFFALMVFYLFILNNVDYAVSLIPGWHTPIFNEMILFFYIPVFLFANSFLYFTLSFFKHNSAFLSGSRHFLISFILIFPSILYLHFWENLSPSLAFQFVYLLLVIFYLLQFFLLLYGVFYFIINLKKINGKN
jgi:hypothetical protein